MLCRKHIKHALAVIFIALSSTSAWGAGYNDVYVIGDSLSDQGNLFTATQALTGNGIPASDHYFDGRFSNGEVYAGLLAKKLGVNLKSSIKGGNNFAYGGARIDYDVAEADALKPFPVSLLQQGGVFPKNLFPWSINGQTAAFAARHVSNPDALYVVFVGPNDIADLIAMVLVHAANPSFPQVDPAAFIAKTLKGADEAIAAAVAAGARDVVVPNLPNFGLVPRISSAGPAAAALATALSRQYNQAFEALVASWAGRVNIIPFDVYALVTNVAAEPAAYGLANVTTACYSGFVSPASPNDTVCPTPNSYLFWDAEHPTAVMHAVLAERMYGAILLDVFDDLTQRLNKMNISSGTLLLLNSKLDGARRRLVDTKTANDGAAVAKLRAFTLAVQAQQRKGTMADADANVLLERAEKVIALVNSL